MVNPSGRPYEELVTLGLATLWIGLLTGVSFLATPAKFLAPDLSLAVALDIGRHTFAILNKGEWLLALEMLVLTLRSGNGRLMLAGVGTAIIVALQAVWLLPILDQRVTMIIAGQSPSSTEHHNVYVGLEMAKLLLLVVIGIRTAIRLARAVDHEEPSESKATSRECCGANN